MINGVLGLLMAANAKRRYIIAYASIASGMWLIYITIGILGEIRLIFKRKPKRDKRERDRDSHVAPPAPHYGAYDMETDETTDVNDETETEPWETTSSRDSVAEDKEMQLQTHGYA
jgi:hypothetical protein